MWRFLEVMRWILLWSFALSLAGSGPVHAAAAKGTIVKVLPHYMDTQGRIATAPSLYERDAYQARLRHRPTECSGIRFDVQWRSQSVDRSRLRFRIELRTSKLDVAKPLTIEAPARGRGFLGRWSSLALTGSEFKEAGEIIAWKVTLLEGENTLAVKQSFLWSTSPHDGP
jgi:hypothetical protein